MRFSTIVSTCAVAVTLSSMSYTTAAEEVYRWVDENGVVHFGDRAPGKGDAEKVAIQQGPADQAAPASQSTTPYAEQTESPQTSVAQQKRNERAMLKQENEQVAFELRVCNSARETVALLGPHPRVIVTNPDGTETQMDADDRVEKLAEAKAFVAENCDD